MARIRYIKPGFFENADIAQLKPLTRLLFVGLWCWADRDGRLLDKPLVIKEAILEHDACNVNAMLSALATAGFIIRYEADGKRLIQIVNWHHQHPHVNEPQSRYPAPPNCRANSHAKDGAEHDAEHHTHSGAGSGAGTRNGNLELGTRNPEHPPPPPNDALDRLIRAYDALMGQPAVTPTILAELEGWLSSRSWASAEEPAEWFEKACREAALANAKSLRYVLRVLERWEREGPASQHDKPDATTAEFAAMARRVQ